VKFALRLRRTDLGAALLAAGTYFAIALYLTHGAWHPPSTEVVGANGDAPQNAWFLAWVAFAISHGTDPLVVTYLSPPGHPLGLMSYVPQVERGLQTELTGCDAIGP
jgi:hypothetical protein